MALHYSQQQIDQLVNPCASRLAQGGPESFYKIYSDLFAFRQQPEKVYDDFICRTLRATAPLNNLNDLITYNALYFAQHLARFRCLLSLVQAQRARPVSAPIRLRVVDYGCGQGLASLALLEHLCPHSRVEIEVHLIEPSALCLYAASRYVGAHAERLQGKVQIHTHACTIDQVPADIFSPHQNTVLHLFSNVLDLTGQPDFDLDPWIQALREAPGKHLVLGASPAYPGSQQGFMRMHTHFPHARNLLPSPRISVRIPAGYTVPSMSGKPITEAQGSAIALLINHR
ncbi:MAG: hypothetical protein ACK4SX_08155 [Alcanivoracaceae bacterium]